MFDSLTEKFSKTLRKIQGRGRLNEDNIAHALKEVKVALLEADVNFRVVKAFTRAVKERALGQEVQRSLTPGQQFFKIVQDELTHMMGEEAVPLNRALHGSSIVMLVGLQGAGKTSSIGKLAKFLQNTGKTPYLIPADIYRPAAIEQLQVIAKSLDLPCYHSDTSQTPVQIVQNALQEDQADYFLIDTAGRLHIDDDLMQELEELQSQFSPHETLFVADAMTGQDAVSVVKTFSERIEITGVMLTKMDGDARGGAALSIRAVTEKPIKFIAVGEKTENLEQFHPDRIASRILGMGDLMSLIEKTENVISDEESYDMVKKHRHNEFTLVDFQAQLRAMQKLGSLKDVIRMIPGVNPSLKNTDLDENKLKRIDAIICSMTARERQNSKIINGSRRKRIAQGSGTSVNEINRLLKQFHQMQKMMYKLTNAKDSRKATQLMQNFTSNY